MNNLIKISETSINISNIQIVGGISLIGIFLFISYFNYKSIRIYNTISLKKRLVILPYLFILFNEVVIDNKIENYKRRFIAFVTYIKWITLFFSLLVNQAELSLLGPENTINIFYECIGHMGFVYFIAIGKRLQFVGAIIEIVNSISLLILILLHILLNKDGSKLLVIVTIIYYQIISMKKTQKKAFFKFIINFCKLISLPLNMINPLVHFMIASSLFSSNNHFIILASKNGYNISKTLSLAISIITIFIEYQVIKKKRDIKINL